MTQMGSQAAGHDHRTCWRLANGCSTTLSGSRWSALIAGVAGYRFSLTERGRDFVDGFRIGLPVFGKIWLKYQVALFARTLSTLLTGGLPLVPSLETAARSISSRRVSKAVMSIDRHGARGQEPGRFADEDRR